MAKRTRKTPADEGPIGAVLHWRPDDLDKRTAAYKYYDALRQAVTADCGGADAITEVRRQLIDRFCSLSLWCQAEDARLLAGERTDIDIYARVSGHLRRLAE